MTDQQNSQVYMIREKFQKQEIDFYEAIEHLKELGFITTFAAEEFLYREA